MNKRHKALVAATLVISMPAMAQITGRSHVNKAQIEQLMQQAKQAQACIANIDQKLMDEFKRKAQKTDEEIKALCAAGRRSAAETRAQKFRTEMADSEVMRETQRCTASMSENLPSFAQDQGTPRNAGHICDR